MVNAIGLFTMLMLLGVLYGQSGRTLSYLMRYICLSSLEFVDTVYKVQSP